MADWKVRQHESLRDAVIAMASGCHVFAIDLDSFEILEIEFHDYNSLLNLSLGHTLLFIEIEKQEDFKF